MNATGYLFGATHPLALKRLRVRGSHLNYPFHLEQGSSCKTLFQICGAVGDFEQCC